MPDTLSLDELARQWRESPGQTAFAALAEGLRKRGDHEAATTVVLQGLGDRPGDLPGLLVLSRIRSDLGDLAGAEQALRDALLIDPTHPVVRRALEVAQARRDAEEEPGDEESDELLFSDDEPDADTSEPLLSESLAVLYHRQGHLERANEVYTALLERDPENRALRERRDRIAAEAEGRRPRPYDAAVSGGRALREWLAALAAVTPPTTGSGTAYDAFFRTPSTPQATDDLADFEAFQSWLKGLDR